jgi:hypothetical protein
MTAVCTSYVADVMEVSLMFPCSCFFLPQRDNEAGSEIAVDPFVLPVRGSVEE